MNSLLIHGVYDSQTLMTLKDKGITAFAFDLRGKSHNLIPFKELKNLLQKLTTEKVFLTFENDRKETINSFLDLLSKESFQFFLIFRDHQAPSYYAELHSPFYWMYDPEGDWKSILSLENCKGVLLPLKYQLEYKNTPALWELIEEREMDVYLHAETFEETLFISQLEDIHLSIDLSSEVENSYRQVDQEKLRNLKIWRRLNENPALK